MLALAVLALSTAVQADAGVHLGFGRSATPAEIAQWDIDVRPDGTGLPEGRGSVADGQGIYDTKCASCHGTFGESTDYIAIAGGVGTLGSDQPVRTTGSKLNYATTLFDYIRRAMPFNAPKSLTNDEVYALTAYVLNLSDIVPADAVLDRRTILDVKMPNRDGFTMRHGLSRVDGKPDTHAVACMTNCAATVRLASEIPEYARDSHGDLTAPTRRAIATDSAAAAASPGAAAKTADVPGADLAARMGCTVCHGIDKAIVGPAFRDVARRYRGKPAAARMLINKVQKGGSGSFGPVPMPPQAVSAKDLETIVDWILNRLQ
ncbi:MAG: c-type cytochrome [Betaproteobacteria bacterium]